MTLSDRQINHVDDLSKTNVLLTNFGVGTIDQVFVSKSHIMAFALQYFFIK